MSWENNIRRVVPYTPGEQPKQQNIVKLNTNENPYPPAPGAAEVLAGFDTALLRKYPDPNAQMLVDAIAKTYGVRPGQVFVGVGSDDVLSMAFMTFFNSEKPILFPDVTYSFYDVWADVYRIPYETVPLDADWRIRPNDYARTRTPPPASSSPSTRSSRSSRRIPTASSSWTRPTSTSAASPRCRCWTNTTTCSSSRPSRNRAAWRASASASRSGRRS